MAQALTERIRALRIVPRGAAAKSLLAGMTLPLLGIAVFLVLWQVAAQHVHTSLGQLPGPVEVWAQTGGLVQEYRDEHAREAAFYERLRERRVGQLAANPDTRFVEVQYTGKPTFIDQIRTSLQTVATGFLLGTLIAVPLGIVCGLSTAVYRAINPLIQLFRPISPLAWLPIVTMVVSALYVSDNPMFAKSYVISAITVTLCCLWPTLINTTIGVAGVSRDLINVARVLRLDWFTKVRRIVLPSALPMIFAGMRVSLGIGWMVLIATEMLAQNPGLGKFVWDEFQNGSSNSLARIMVAVVTIGLVGFLLDRLMLLLQRWVSWDRQAVLR